MKKILLSILSVSMLFHTINIYADDEIVDDDIVQEEAEQQEESTSSKIEDIISTEDFYINPLYADIMDESDLIYPSDDGINTLSDSIVYTTIDDAGAYLRELMGNHIEKVSISYSFPKTDVVDMESNDYAKSLARQISTNAMIHTGNPTQGDYIKWQYGGYRYTVNGASVAGIYTVTIDYTFTYYTSLEQEAQLNEEVTQLLNTLNVYNASDYMKIRAIYDWLCENVRYDSNHVGDVSYKLQYTAYSALVNKTSVCQGYANLFYRLALTLGVDARIITGLGNGGKHAWNIVQIGDFYYNLDSTWDAGKVYRYFLLDAQTFNQSHIRDAEYTVDEFNQNYPMSDSGFVTVNSLTIDQENMNCSVADSGTLTFTLSSEDEGIRSLIRWSSSNEGVVYIDDQGNYNCLNKGSAIITASYLDGTSDSIQIEVNGEEEYVGWIGMDSGWKYYDGTSFVESGWRDIENERYFFENGLACNGWKVIDGKSYYFNSYKMVKGYVEIEGVPYYFNEDGTIYTGLIEVDGASYAFTKDGALNGWQTINQIDYYFENYKMITGYKLIKNIPYYFNEDGSLHVGWQDVEGKTYYFTTDGAINGWQTIQNNTYYFHAYECMKGLKTINGNKYYFNEDGSMHLGWKEYKGAIYYFEDTGAVNNWQKIDGIWYFFDAYQRVSNQRKENVLNSNETYAFDENGKMITGWNLTGDDYRYYQANGKEATGWLKQNGRWYYLDSSNENVMVRSAQKQVDGTVYWFDVNGTWVKAGWTYLKDGWIYLNNNKKVIGWYKVGSKWYYFNSQGIMQTGMIKDASNKTYYLSGNGAMLTGWQKINEKWYYFNSDRKTNWQQINNKWYYFDSDGIMQTGVTTDQSGKVYYLSDGGNMLTGWQKIDGNWYYFKSNRKTDWQKINNKWYYFEEDGVMVTGEKTVNGKVYKFDTNGVWIQ